MFKGGYILGGGVDYVRAAHSGSEGGIYSGEMGRLWEGRISKGRGYILGGRVRFWEGRIDSGSVTYSCRKGGGVYSGRKG